VVKRRFMSDWRAVVLLGNAIREIRDTRDIQSPLRHAAAGGVRV